MGRYDINVLPGDGIGTEVTEEGVKLLQAIGRCYGHTFDLTYGIVGGAAIDEYGVALTDETLAQAKRSDAVLFGAVGGPQWDDPKAAVRPEQAILGLRKGLGLFANLRPVKVFPQLADSSPVKRELVSAVDLMVVRELTGGLYFAPPKKRWQTSRGRRAVDTLSYSEREIERVLRVGFELARGRRRKLASVDKANILQSSMLWREIAMELASDYPDVSLEHVLVDTAAMRLVRQPAAFDVIVTENMFGDILTDEASVLAGSMGMLPSASLGSRTRRVGGVTRTFGMYEPIHGSAPDIAGQNKANPLAMLLSVAMMLRLSCGLTAEADAVEAAVQRVLAEGYRTADVAAAGAKVLGTTEMGAQVIERI